MALFAVVLLSLITLIGPSTFAEDLALEDYLAEVEASNPMLKSVVTRSEALWHRVQPAGTWDDPFIAAGFDEQPFKGQDTTSVRRYQISQSIPFPGKLSAKQKSAEMRAVSARSDVQTQKREVLVLATQVFFRRYYNQEAIVVTERIRNLVEGTMTSTKSRYKTGESGHHDWLLAKIELAVLDVDRLRLSREQKTISAVFNELRNQPPEKPIGSLKVSLNSSAFKQEEVDDLLKDQPELASLDSLIKAAEQDQRAAKLSYFPDFVLQGMMMEPRGMAPSTGMGMGAEPEMKGSNWGFMVGMNLPIFFFRKQSELASAASRDRAAAVFEKESLQNRIRSEVVDAKEQFTTARDTARLYKESVIPATNLAVSNARSGYAAKRLPLTQLLETLKAQRTQELEFLAAQIDVELARTRLEQVLSSPPMLRLAPGRPTLFGGGGMGGGMAPGMSGTVNLGSGMSGPSRKSGGSASGASEGGKTGMEGM